MKYSQLVHMPRDVKHWLEQQLEAHGIDGVAYTKYLISLLKEDTFDDSPNHAPPILDSKKKYDIENLVDELCTKLKEIENRGSSGFDLSSSERKTDALAMDSTIGFPYKLNNSMNCMEPIQPCLPPNSAWTRGLLHDSALDNNKSKMDDYLSTLFCDNPGDGFGSELAWNKSVEPKVGDTETDRINFYNKQNLLASECSERLYERNADVDKLIAKFDANIEDLWKTNSDSDHLANVKYQTLISHNFFPNPHLHYGSNVIWSFGQNENDGKSDGTHVDEEESGKVPKYKSSFSHWNKFSSPVLTNSNTGFDSMLSAFNLTLSNIQKWSAMDGYNNGFPNQNKSGGCFTEVVTKSSEPNSEGKVGLGYAPEAGSNNQEEEDLLTSAKTHFRPIRSEELGGSHTGVYADGTTFAISNDLEKVSFKRSESGTLYLEADANTPRKYMEFKEKEGTKGDIESETSSVEEFVPKFRVRQSNEKCCQTDEINEEQMVPSSMNETDCDSVSYESEEDEFYFPGDDELAQNIINAIEEESRTEREKTDADHDELSPTGEIRMEILDKSHFDDSAPELIMKELMAGNNWVGSEDTNKTLEWSELWNSDATCDSCKMNSDKLSTKDKFRFREELIQEGEQLLLDLSCLQQLYSNSDWCDDDSITASDLNEEEAQNSGEDVASESAFVSSETGSHFNKEAWWNAFSGKEESAKKGFDLSCFWREEKLLPTLLENDKINEINERPFIADVIQTERKRRNSSSQKACDLYLEGQCRRPHCRFAHRDSAIPCPFFADASCMKGESCPLSHATRRPLSL